MREGQRLGAIKTLEDILDPETKYPDFGLCKQLMAWLPTQEIHALFDGWPDHSGCKVFPVPHPEYAGPEFSSRQRGDKAEWIYITLPFDGLYTGEYGRLRLDLAKYALDKLIAMGVQP